MNFSEAITSPWGFICNSQVTIRSRGVFYGEDPFNISTQVLLFQIILSSLLISTLHYLMAPFGQSAFTAQMIGGILLGPTGLRKFPALAKKIFPDSSIYFSETLALFGCMIFLFLVGVKMDTGQMKKSGRKGVIIGLGHFFLPLAIVFGLSHNFKRSRTLDPIISKSIHSVAALMSMSSSHVITCLLTDLKILNSELARLAISSSMISCMCSWTLAMGSYVAYQGRLMDASIYSMVALVVSFFILVLVVVYLLRPIMNWMVGRNAEGKPVKESHIRCIFIMIMGIALFGEILGQHYLVGPVVLGIMVPDGPPLGSALIERLECFSSIILLPLFYVLTVVRTDFSAITSKNLAILAVIAFGAVVGKVVGATLPAMYYRMPVDDALSLGLVMSAQGITEVMISGRALMLGFLDEESYSIMMLCMIVFSGAIAPIVKMLYKPRKYTSFRPRTILHSALDSELRLLACIYREYNTSCLLNLLEVSNPSLEGQICFYLVHLVELEGRASSMFVAHRPGKRTSAYTAKSEHIINAFSLYQQHNTGALVVNPYTSIAPYETIHQDVCELALEKRVAMVIIPFHKRFTIAEDLASSAMRIVNRNIMENSPCSIGILVDRGTLPANTLLFTSKTLYRIGMLFLGGPDDREALAYAMRMAGHPNVRLTVIHFVNQTHQRRSDYELMDECKLANLGSKSLIFKEEQAKDSLEIITMIQTLEDSYELLLVGRSHVSESVGFTEWIEFPELGYIGDMLVSSDSKCKASLLVVQQQAFVGDDMPSPFMETKPYAVVDMEKEQSVS